MGRRRRRFHSDEFKGKVVAACKPIGTSIAAVAMAHGINANLARRWIVAAERRCSGQSTAVTSNGNVAPPSFVPVTLAPTVALPAEIRIELRRGATIVNVNWPCTEASGCATWLRELLR